MEQILELLEKKLIDFIQTDKFMLESKVSDKNTDTTPYTSNKVKLSSVEFKRKISISLTDYYSHKRLFFNIYNIDGGSHNSIMLDKYLEQFCGVSNAKNLMLLEQYSGESIEEKLNTFFIQIRSKLDSRFFDILKGTTWVEITFDWEKYK